MTSRHVVYRSEAAERDPVESPFVLRSGRSLRTLVAGMESSGTRIGTEIAGFRIESVLGRGGMSVVYLAEQTRLGRKVALKILATGLLERDEHFRNRFLQESHVAAALDHPNIIPIYDAGEDGDCLYIAMRYVEGRDLAQVMSEEGRSASDARSSSWIRWPAPSTPRTSTDSSTVTSNRPTSSSSGTPTASI